MRTRFFTWKARRCAGQVGTTKDTRGDWRLEKRLITETASVCMPEPSSMHLIRGAVGVQCGHECGVTACLDDTAAIQRQDLVGRPHRREAVADQQRCLPSDELAEVLEELVFSVGIQR